ncbi:TAXI family TRAP transporter solute-binding subunit [Lacimonas salitolerans]|uniref:TAXI family TRAP transporter solute-binding subunit n=1 Tax=Lacimonas salitolerans TaxID=1323750 RepID=A0ABW4EHE9_9RHOB
MQRNKITATLIGSFALALGLSGAAQAQDDFSWPRLLVIATPGTSSGSFASTNGWAPILQEQKGVTVRVVPEDSEPMRHRRLVDRRDIAIASVSGAEMRSQAEGTGGYAPMTPASQRIMWHHNDTPWGFVVSGNSDIESLDDLKKGGYRVTNGIFSPTIVETITVGLPDYLDLTQDEAQDLITFVPASSYAESCRSVVEGRSDVAYCAPISSVLSEMEGAPGGIRWLEMPASNTEGWGRLLATRSMLVPATISMGVQSARGIESATSNFVYAVPTDADTDFVYNMAKWMHEAHDDYKGTHPLATRMSLEEFRNYLDNTPIPVHEGTVRYLREIDAWTDEDDAWNNAAIELMDAWIAARQEALDEAREKRIDIAFDNPEFLEILEAKTEGLEIFRSRL